jgi:N-acetylglucosamine-6-phosphate deacetylase
MSRVFLTGARVVMPDRVAAGCSLVIRDGLIEDVHTGAASGGPGDAHLSMDGRIVVPGFIDAHVHGIEGTDVLDGPGAVRDVASRLPRYGVTAFCPTSVACPAETLTTFLQEVDDERRTLRPVSARVIAAHLESNFISPMFSGAQPLEYVCAADGAVVQGGDILAVIDRLPSAIAIVTLAPELPGGVDLVRRLVARGILVSLGHSGATFDEARAAIHAGASRATHLFCAMPPLGHREPGLVGAVLAHDHVQVELICDGVHVHPVVMRVTIAAKGAGGVVAITDGTAASGLPRGTVTRLGQQRVTAADVARLDDGRAAGSVLTMDRAFEMLVRTCQCDLVDAAHMCATTPAADLRLPGRGTIAPGSTADVTVLDEDLRVVETWVGGTLAWRATGHDPMTSRS